MMHDKKNNNGFMTFYVHHVGYKKKQKVKINVKTIVYHYVCKKCITKEQQKITFNFFLGIQNKMRVIHYCVFIILKP